MNLAKDLQRKTRSGIAIGTTVTLSDLGVTESLGLAGLDFVWIDMEHTPLGKQEVYRHLIAARAARVASCVRVPWNDAVQMKPILDMGPDALIVPQVRTLQDARDAVDACRYPPAGARGFGPLRASGYGTYQVTADALEEHKRSLLFIQVEHVDCVQALDEILSLEGIDGFIVGPMDLSASIGKLGQLEDAELNALMDRLARKIVGSSRLLGVSMAFVPHRVKAWISRGATFISLGQDVEHLVGAVASMVDAVEATWKAVQDKPREHQGPRERGFGGSKW